jgi:thiol oxidase
MAPFILLCLVLSVAAPVAQARPGAINQVTLDPLSPVYELTSATFNNTLAAAPTPWALVEFYAHWCGACKHFKPHYERVAKLFNGPNAAHAGEVYLARVDCANNINQDLCTRFGVQYYPTLLWAAPPTIARGSRLKKSEELEEIEKTYSDHKLLEWINKRLSKAYSLSDVAAGDAVGAGTPVREIVQMAASVHDTEEATAQAFKIIVDEKLLNGESRGPLVRFMQLLVAHHPSKRCRKGTAGLLVEYDDLWSQVEPSTESLSKHNVCGKSLPSNFWVSCRGENRGYNCGLWLLFHSLSVRVSDSESTEAFLAIRGFVDHFFKCQECREHFLQMSSSQVNTTKTQRDLVMWLWQAHNEVNIRLAKEDLESGKADSESPRTVWPTKQICSDCFVGTNVVEPVWNEDAVYKFLTNWYGSSLQQSASVGRATQAEISSGGGSLMNASMIGLCFVGSGVGFVAWWWSKQQKKRKY